MEMSTWKEVLVARRKESKAVEIGGWGKSLQWRWFGKRQWLVFVVVHLGELAVAAAVADWTVS